MENALDSFFPFSSQELQPPGLGDYSLELPPGVLPAGFFMATSQGFLHGPPGMILGELDAAFLGGMREKCGKAALEAPASQQFLCSITMETEKPHGGHGYERDGPGTARGGAKRAFHAQLIPVLLGGAVGWSRRILLAIGDGKDKENP